MQITEGEHKWEHSEASQLTTHHSNKAMATEWHETSIHDFHRV